MMQTRSGVLSMAVAAFAALVSCSRPLQMQVDVKSPSDLQQIAGTWHGEYKVDGSDGRGEILFSLEPSKESAIGEVLMRSSDAAWWRHKYAQPQQYSQPVVLIQAIRVTHGFISGTLEPFWDADQSCVAHTTFVGKVAKGVMDGTFDAACDGGLRHSTGTWTARGGGPSPSP
jgi:hypothetical protein